MYGLVPGGDGDWERRGKVKEGRSKTWAEREAEAEVNEMILRRDALVRREGDGAGEVWQRR